MKTARDSEIVKAIGGRFCQVLSLLSDSLASSSKLVGYRKPSTVYTIKKGEALPDIVRLQKLAEQRLSDGRRPNIHWLVTGEGEMLMSDVPTVRDDSPLGELCRALVDQPDERLRAILTLLEEK